MLLKLGHSKPTSNSLRIPRLFPLSHTRRYIHRTEGKTENTERNGNSPATVIMGSQTDFDYDAIAELSFADANAFQAFFGLFQQPENAARFAADEEQFLDRSRSKPLSHTHGPCSSRAVSLKAVGQNIC